MPDSWGRGGGNTRLGEKGYGRPPGKPQNNRGLKTGRQSRTAFPRKNATLEFIQYCTPLTRPRNHQALTLEQTAHQTPANRPGSASSLRPAFPIHPLGPRLLRSRNCARLVEPEPAWRRPCSQSAPRRGRWPRRGPRGGQKSAC